MGERVLTGGVRRTMNAVDRMRAKLRSCAAACRGFCRADNMAAGWCYCGVGLERRRVEEIGRGAETERWGGRSVGTGSAVLVLLRRRGGTIGRVRRVTLRYRGILTLASKLSFWRLEIWTSGKAHGPMGELAGRPSPGMMGPVQVASA